MVLAKAIAAVLVTIPATGAAFGVGALGNVAGAAMADVPAVWNQSFVEVGSFALGQTLLLLVGFVLGALIRNSSGAIVAYMLYGFVAPGLLASWRLVRTGSRMPAPGWTRSTARMRCYVAT